MNRILLLLAEVKQAVGGDRIAILPETDVRAVHAKKVLKVGTGDVIRVAVEGEGLCNATVIETENGFGLQLGDISPARDLPPITLLLALPRPRAAKRAVRAAAQMGVREICLVGAARVEKSFFEAKDTRIEVLTGMAREGVMQAAVDAHVPQLRMEPRLWRVGEHLPDDVVRVVLHPTGAKPLGEVLREKNASKIVLAVGPEGGWLNNEVEFLMREGFVPAGLGIRILSSEVAVAVALTVTHEHINNCVVRNALKTDAALLTLDCDQTN